MGVPDFRGNELKNSAKLKKCPISQQLIGGNIFPICPQSISKLPLTLFRLLDFQMLPETTNFKVLK